MIDIQRIECPKCRYHFDYSTFVGEEVTDGNVRLTKKSDQKTSWDELNEIIRSGWVQTLLDAGDKLSFLLKDGRRASIDVLSINPYGNNVAFAFTDIIWKKPMNDRDTNSGGWANSEMAEVLDNEILPLLPDELVEVIAPREIVQKIDGTTYKRTSKLWLPSLTEVRGRRDDHAEYDEVDFGDVHFDGFRTEKNRVKCLEDGKTYWYWLRSPNVSNSTSFWYVGYSGYVNYGGASSAHGVCPCFIIGDSPEKKRR